MTCTEKFFLECVKAGILGGAVSAMPEGVDPRRLYSLALSHSMSAATLAGCAELLGELPAGFATSLGRAAERMVVRDLQSAHDISVVLAALEERGLKHMPLKGYHLKGLYPKSNMRYASDCDVLIDEGEIDSVRALCRELGLKVEHFDEHHDVYYFPSTGTVFEMHKTLFVGPLSDYFGVGFERAKLREGKGYFYELSPEDFYVTILAHSAYHFAHGGGVGIRHLTDIFLFRREVELDDAYLTAELRKCGLEDFRRRFEAAADYLFGDGGADEFTLRLAEHIISSTVLANDEKQHASDVAANSEGRGEAAAKGKTLFRLIFPSKSTMLFAYPVLKKAPIFYPLFYPVRWFEVLFTRPGSVRKIAGVTSTDTDEIEQMKYIRDGLGLKADNI